MKRLYEHDACDNVDEGAAPPKVQRRIDDFSVITDEQERPEDRQSICAVCATIIRAGVFRDLVKGGASRRLMGLANLDSPEALSCPICRLFIAVREMDEDEKYPRSYALYLHTIATADIWGRTGRSVLAVALDHPCTGTRQLEGIVDTWGGVAVLANNWTTGPGRVMSSVAARRICPEAINFKLLRHWIDSCMENHEKCQRHARGSPLPVGLKLIDCETRQIVQNQSHKYVALSYVWGAGSNSFDGRQINGILPDSLPQTIEDAILVTLKLRYRYLWIDRYCINQGNPDEVKSQIEQMNLIYRKSEVTIIAAAGHDPSFGLPGVDRTSRKPQPTGWIGGLQCVSILPNPGVAISNSKWSSRGWTYQEGYFSLRRLFFLEEQVYFSCYNASAVETICDINEAGLSCATEDKDDGDQEAYEILDHLRTYSGRQLTHQSDAVRAVAGVFNDNSPRHGVTPNWLGVPIVRFSLFDRFVSGEQRQRRRATDGFLIGLCWQNREPGKQRHIWPSWTWAEWVVPFDYGTRGPRPMHDHFTLSTDFVVRPRVFIETRTGALLDLQEKSTLDTITRSPARLSNFVWIETWTLALDIHHIADQTLASYVEDRVKMPKDFNEKNDATLESYYATLKGKDAKIAIPIWPMHPSYSNTSSTTDRVPRFAPGMEPNGGGGEILGIILARCILKNSRWSLVTMVVQKKGTHFERIGHCNISCEQIRELAESSGPVEHDWVFGWKKFHNTTARLCAKYMEPRRPLRLG